MAYFVAQVLGPWGPARILFRAASGEDAQELAEDLGGELLGPVENLWETLWTTWGESAAAVAAQIYAQVSHKLATIAPPGLVREVMGLEKLSTVSTDPTATADLDQKEKNSREALLEILADVVGSVEGILGALPPDHQRAWAATCKRNCLLRVGPDGRPPTADNVWGGAE